MIKLLDVRAQWGFIKSVFNSSNRLYSAPPAQPVRTFASGIDPLTEQAQYATPKGQTSAFTGKTFSQRK